MMTQLKNDFGRGLRSIYRLWLPLVNPAGLVTGIAAYPGYLRDLREFGNKSGEKISWLDLQPILNNQRGETELDYHYFFQALWLWEKVRQIKPTVHYDVASDAMPIAMIAQTMPVVFVDIRPLPVKFRNFKQVKGDATHLPFKSGSIKSLSCCHVIEHIGLGRYGDDIDPDGAVKAAKELTRILARGGDLLVSTPVGIPRIMFNAHRIFSPEKVENMFSGLKLREFKLVTDNGKLVNGDRLTASRQNYGLGLYHWKKP